MDSMLAEMEQVRIGTIDYRNPRIPVFPRTAIEVLRMQEAATNDVRQLAGVVSGDPACTQMLLRRANSPYYGLRRKVGDVSHAVTLLGFGPTAELVLSLAMLRLGEVFPERNARLVFQRITRVSLATAWSARLLADLIRQYLDHAPSTVSAFSVGLMHATGRLVLLYNDPGSYTALCGLGHGTSPDTNGVAADALHLPSVTEERRALGTDHEILGSVVCAVWGLPSLFSRVLSPFDEQARFERREDEMLTYVVKAAAASAEALTWDPEDANAVRIDRDEEGEPEDVIVSAAEVPAAVVRLARVCQMHPLDLASLMAAWEDEVRLFVDHVLTP